MPKFQRLLLNLLRTSLLSAVQTGVKILAGFALVKVVALTSGPSGLAQLGQFQNLVGLVAMLSGGMFYTGVTKLVAQYGEIKEKWLAVVRMALTVSVVCALAMTSFLVCWEDYISQYALKDVYLDWISPALPPLIFLTVLNGLWLALLNGLGRIRELVIANIAASVLMVVLVFVLSPRYGQSGIFLSILLPPAIVILAVVLTRFRLRHWIEMCTTRKTNKPPYGELMRFALMGLISAAAAPLAQLTMRDYLTQTLSLADAGIWQGITRISEVYLIFITSSLSVYYLPKLAKMTDADSLRELINSVLRLVIPASLILGCMVYLSKDLLILILFTPEFNSMSDLFLWQIIGDMIKIVAWVFAYVILAGGLIIPFIFGELLFNATHVGLGMLMVPNLGLKGAVFAYGINYIFYLAYVVVVVKFIHNRLAVVKLT